MAPHILFFDLETRKRTTDLSKDNDEGWRLLREGKGGISALAIWDNREEWCYFYDDSEIETIAAYLESAEIVVGFNSRFFDIPVVEGILGRRLALREHIDLYEEVKRGLSKLGQRGRKGEYTLGAICSRTLGGQGKLESGALAPDLAKDGLWARLFRYCADDVRKTRNLFGHIQSEGGIISVNQTFLPIELPNHLTPQARA